MPWIKIENSWELIVTEEDFFRVVRERINPEVEEIGRKIFEESWEEKLDDYCENCNLRKG